MTTPPLEAPEPASAERAVDDPEVRNAPLGVRIVDHTIEALAALTLAGITLLLFVNACLRYFFDSPIGWAEEISTGMVIWLAMLGLLVAARRRDLIVVRVFVRQFPARVQVWLKILADALTALVFTHLAWVSFQYVQAFGSDQSAYLRLPKGFFTVAIPLGAIAVAIVVALQIPTARAYVERHLAEDDAARAAASEQKRVRR